MSGRTVLFNEGRAIRRVKTKDDEEMHMKHRIQAVLVAGSLMAAMLAQGATVAYWDFETHSVYGPATNGMQFTDSDAGAANGSAGALSSGSLYTMFGWNSYYGPSFTSDNLYYNGLAMRNADNHQDGYAVDAALTTWSPTNWTIECSVKLNELGGWRTILGKDGASFGQTESDFYLQRMGDTNGFWRLNYRTAGAQQIVIDSSNVVVQAGQWYGLAAVSDGSDVYLYIDDQDGNGYELEGTAALTNALPADNALSGGAFNWTFGRGWFDGNFGDNIDGYMDNVRFSDTALLPAELIELPEDPFTITYAPTEAASDTTQTIEATVVDLDSEFSSATLRLDGAVIAVNNTPSGLTNTVSSVETGLTLGSHTGSVEVVGINPSVTVTQNWTFVIQQPAFGSITTTPTGLITDVNPSLEAVVVEDFAFVDSAQMFLDGVEVFPVDIDRSLAPSTTVSYAASGLLTGVHTGKVVVVGSPYGLETNEWTFSVFADDATKPITLRHHWAFSETSGVLIEDSVGNADGTIIGTNHVLTGRALDLFGSGVSDDWDGVTTSAAGSYVNLPNGILSTLANAVTFEAVYVIDDQSAIWQRVWDFGSSDAGEDNGGLAGSDIFLTPNVGGSGSIRMEISSAAPGYENVVVNITSAEESAEGELLHVVTVYDADTKTTVLYVNGELSTANVDVATSYPVSSINDVNNWLGRSQYGGDSMFNGKIDDMRIYDGVMTSAEAAARYQEVLASVAPTVDPVITNIDVAGSIVTLSWTAEDVGSYSIQRKLNLPSGSWSTVVSNLPFGNLTTNVTASGANAEFYQVIGE